MYILTNDSTGVLEVNEQQLKLIKEVEDIFFEYKVAKKPKKMHVLFSQASDKTEPLPPGAVVVHYGLKNNNIEKLFEKTLGEEVRKRINSNYSFHDIQYLKESNQITDDSGNIALENVLQCCVGY